MNVELIASGNTVKAITLSVGDTYVHPSKIQNHNPRIYMVTDRKWQGNDDHVYNIPSCFRKTLAICLQTGKGYPVDSSTNVVPVEIVNPVKAEILR